MIAGYMSSVFASSSLPGVPVWQTPPEVLQEVLLESLDFFYIQSGLMALGISPIPSPAVSTGSLCLFLPFKHPSHQARCSMSYRRVSCAGTPCERGRVQLCQCMVRRPLQERHSMF